NDEAIWHFDGASWMQSPVNSEPWFAIRGFNEDAVYAVGLQSIYRLGTARSNLWQPAFTPDPNAIDYFFGVHMLVPTELFIVGYHYMAAMPPLPGDSTGTIRHSLDNGQSWLVDRYSQDTINAVWGNSGEVFVVGARGVIVHYIGVTGTPENSNVN